jgi:predicted nicotinamide N-methyase
MSKSKKNLIIPIILIVIIAIGFGVYFFIRSNEPYIDINGIKNLVFDKKAYLIPETEKKLFKKHNNSPTNKSHTFGTLEKDGLNDIVNFYKKKISNNLSDKNFIDLGSGDGRVTIWASVYGFKNSHGVELSPHRHNLAINNLKNIKSNNIRFFNDDILNHDIRNYDLMYISSICFHEDFLKKLREKIDVEGKKNSMIVCSKQMSLKNYKSIGQIKINQSWSKGKNTGYVYVKIK